MEKPISPDSPSHVLGPYPALPTPLPYQSQNQGSRLKYFYSFISPPPPPIISTIPPDPSRALSLSFRSPTQRLYTKSQQQTSPISDHSSQAKPSKTVVKTNFANCTYYLLYSTCRSKHHPPHLCDNGACSPIPISARPPEGGFGVFTHPRL